MSSIGKKNRNKLPAISSGETFLRRVSVSFYPDGQHPDKPKFDAFLPRRWRSDEDKGDHDGLSVSREWFTTIEKAAWNEGRKETHNVARVGHKAILSLDLTAIQDEQDHDLSHALIPQLNSVDYKDKAKKKAIKSKARELAFVHAEMELISLKSSN